MTIDHHDLKHVLEVRQPINAIELGKRCLLVRHRQGDLERDVQIVAEADGFVMTEIKPESASAGEKPV